MVGAVDITNQQLPDRAWLLDLVRLLQTTLEVSEVLRLFSEKCSELVMHTGLRFQDDGEERVFEFGSDAKHVCQYDVVVDERALGTIWFTRITPFAEPETEALEILLSNLMHPLRNALTHRHVLDAASRDPLTGLLNRASLNSTITREVQLAQRHSTPLSVIMIDIDHFKSVNDSHGHIVGDLVLREVARRLLERVRASDSMFRFGGEEFIVVLRNTDLQGTHLLADRLRLNVNNTPVDVAKLADGINTTVSAGVAEIAAGDSMDTFLSRADAALYQAKDAGRNCVRMASADNDVVDAGAAAAVSEH